VVQATEKVGPSVFRIVEEVGEDGAPKALKLMSRRGKDALWVVSKPGRFALFARYGDDAADAMIKHGEIVEALIGSDGEAGARAMAAVDSQNARRFKMLADEGVFANAADPQSILGTVGQYGDQAADWIWRNKGAIGVASVATAFVRNPTPFLNGAVEVVRIGGETVVRPVIEKASDRFSWTVLVMCALAALTVVIASIFFWMKLPLFGLKALIARRSAKNPPAGGVL
jgi:hypothetical protein